MSCQFLLQGIFPTQGSNPGLLHCRQTFFFFTVWATSTAIDPGLSVSSAVGGLSSLPFLLGFVSVVHHISQLLPFVPLPHLLEKKKKKPQKTFNYGLIGSFCFPQVYTVATEHCWGMTFLGGILSPGWSPTSIGLWILTGLHCPLLINDPIKTSCLSKSAPLLSAGGVTSYVFETRDAFRPPDHPFYEASFICLQPPSSSYQHLGSFK